MTTHALYRFFDHTGQLLYVGITMDPAHRWRKHRAEKPWWHHVASITIETHETRQAVLTAEARAIRRERPAHNVVHAAQPPHASPPPKPHQPMPAPIEGDYEHRKAMESAEWIRRGMLVLAEHRANAS